MLDLHSYTVILARGMSKHDVLPLIIETKVSLGTRREKEAATNLPAPSQLHPQVRQSEITREWRIPEAFPWIHNMQEPHKTPHLQMQPH